MGRAQATLVRTTLEPIDLTDRPSERIFLDPSILLSTRLLLCCNSGAGKSRTVRRMAEWTMPQIQTFIIDPDGEFATLREKFDAVIVGPEGEVVASVATAEAVCRRFVELGVNAIFDLSELSLREQCSYVKIFFETLLRLDKKLWHPIIIYLDEAQRFAPQEGHAESHDAVVALAAQGRKRSYCLVPATQRIAKLSKNVTAECNNRMIGRLAEDIDLKRATDILGMGKSGWTTIRELEPGEFFCMGPAFNFKGSRKVTVGKVATTHPEPGERHKLQTPAPSSAIRAVVGQFAELQRKAEKEADEREELRKNVVRLEDDAESWRSVAASLERENRELVAEVEQLKKRAGSYDLHAVRDAERKGYEKGWSDCTERAREHARDVSDKIAMTLGSDEAMAMSDPSSRLLSTHIADDPTVPYNEDSNFAESIDARIERVREGFDPEFLADVKERRERRPFTRAPLTATPPDDIGRGAPMKCLTVLLQYNEAMDKNRIFALAGLSQSGNSNNAIYSLHGAGLLEYTAEKKIIATALARRKYAGKFERLPTGRALLDYWQGKLGPGAPGKCFAVLRRATRPMSKEEIFKAAEISESGNSNNAIYKMRGLGLLHDHPDKRISLSKNLIP